ncbi:phage tail sheath C-terminal domain-containing protein [Okeania sp. SIO1I7]|uniref:phage tail sheath family protein n=1 Tax=Okeania sp. SIO1I7 TaxID=2607772 RepID=UPI0013FA2EA6|nr:phage tail sheath C-terminal domain-containing protein [Okeania sp. SIO1I7]NET28626.1 phage tail sheath family protein [Okeania sp. SIO1I7]
MVNYKTPNVYIEEISKLPPSVAGVSTGIPAFIGYTEKAEDNGEDLTNVPTRITSLLEYETFFGLAKATEIEVTTDGDEITNIVITEPIFLMYYALQMFFNNGGGACYIVSVGPYTSDDSKDPALFTDGLAALKKEDEPTLILLSDAVNLDTTSDYYGLCVEALAQCNTLQDRFAVFDVVQEDSDPITDAAAFRSAVSSEYLNYGAAYYPYLQTSLNYYYTDDSVTVDVTGTLGEIKDTQGALYNAIKSEISKKRIILPPSSAIAGVYARVDRDRGVWKAPANVSLASVTVPTVKITNEDQEDLNVDTIAGKSINAIRYFTGKGVLVWGARTLAGNDNEWRYVPVRRLFIYVEESVQQATEFAIFEPNVSVTWLKVKSMIESFLEGLWRQGALAGSTAEQAFFVNVGLGVTMTSQDILEGRMNVEIGLAAVRPAEFIILKFSHKLQEA